MAADKAGYTVLVVEDDPTHQLLIRKALDADGSPFSVVQFAENSADAEQYARQMLFDVVLVDNRIPGRRGLDLISALKDDGVDAPFVLMTSAGNEDLAVQAYRSRVADYIVKDAGFWRDLGHTLTRVIAADRDQKGERQLRGHLERANKRLDELNTEVQLHNHQLQQAQEELARRAAELEQLNRKLADAYRTLGDFTFVVSRSLSRPLTTLREALDEVDPALADGDARDALARARDARDHVARLLERVHRMSVLCQLKEDPAHLDIESVLDRVQEDLAREARS